ncbi:MAG: NAD(P)H-hydrate epimerase [Thermoanaerobaculia bacterium]
MRARFVTPEGIAVPAVTAEEMREIDRIALEETGPNLYQMMENAGRDLALLALELLGSAWRDASVLVLAGSGGNGGGGICAARHLANRRVRTLVCLAQPDRLGEVPAFQRKIFGSTSGREVTADKLESVRPDLILDALIGYGLRSAPAGNAAALIGWANRSEIPVLSLDVPSGLNATTGEAPAAVIRAKRTLTLALPKTGLAAAEAGELFLGDIGIPESAYRRLSLNYVSPFGSRFRVALLVTR